MSRSSAAQNCRCRASAVAAARQQIARSGACARRARARARAAARPSSRSSGSRRARRMPGSCSSSSAVVELVARACSASARSRMSFSSCANGREKRRVVVVARALPPSREAMRARLGERRDEALRQRDRRAPQAAEPLELDALARASSSARVASAASRSPSRSPARSSCRSAPSDGELRGAVLGRAARPVGLLVPLEQMNDAVEIAKPLHERAQLLRREVGLHGRARRALQVLGPIADEHGARGRRAARR